MPLNPGDTWTGLDVLVVVDEATGERLLENVIVSDMDINPGKNEITMFVSSDISYG